MNINTIELEQIFNNIRFGIKDPATFEGFTEDGKYESIQWKKDYLEALLELDIFLKEEL